MVRDRDRDSWREALEIEEEARKGGVGQVRRARQAGQAGRGAAGEISLDGVCVRWVWRRYLRGTAEPLSGSAGPDPRHTVRYQLCSCPAEVK